MGKAGDFMKSLGGGLLSAGANALTGGFGGLISGGLSALTKGLFGPSISKQIRLQKEAQMELNEQAARLNYDYGEKSAENAYNRQMSMYERSYDDQSYKAMRKQMEDAGLSVGLMYGQGGSGGGAGSMSGAPQGATGGAMAGDAGGVVSAALQMQLQKQIQDAEIAKLNAETRKTEAETDKIEEEGKTIEQSRDAIVAGLRESARTSWIANNIEQFNQWLNQNHLFGKGSLQAKWTDDTLGEFEAKSESLTSGTAVTKVIDAAMGIIDTETRASLMATEEALNERRTSAITQELIMGWMQLKVAQQNANTLEAEAATRRIEAGIKKLLAAKSIEVSNAQIASLINGIETSQNLTEFHTGAWGKAAMIIHGAAQLGQLYVGGKIAGAAGAGKTIEKYAGDGAITSVTKVY